MSFEEFLKLIEKEVYFSDNLNNDTHRYWKRNLGEWAWEQVLENYVLRDDIVRYKVFHSPKHSKETLFEFILRCSHNYKQWEIAVACLGKEIVEKRLKELK